MHHVYNGAISGSSRRVRRQVATAIDVGKVEAAVFQLIVNHIHRDASRDVAVLVAAAESVSNLAALQVECDIARDVGSRSI